MGIGPRIKARLAKLGMSQAELARRTNLHQTTINGLVTGQSRSSAHIHIIARELLTTTEYLSGETDDPDAEHIEDRLTAEERNWVDWLRAAAPEDRKALARLARTIATSAPRPTLHDGQQEYRAAS